MREPVEPVDQRRHRSNDNLVELARLLFLGALDRGPDSGGALDVVGELVDDLAAMNERQYAAAGRDRVLDHVADHEALAGACRHRAQHSPVASDECGPAAGLGRELVVAGLQNGTSSSSSSA